MHDLAKELTTEKRALFRCTVTRQNAVNGADRATDKGSEAA